MCDKKILDTVYRWMNQSIERNEDSHFSKRRLKDCRDFIEQEWQRRDEKDAKVAADEMMEAADEVFDCRHDNYFGPNEFTN